MENRTEVRNRTLKKLQALAPLAVALLSPSAVAQEASPSPDARSVLDAFFAKVAKFQTISGNYFEVTTVDGKPSGASTGSFAAKKPNIFKLDLTDTTVINDGARRLVIDHPSHTAREMVAVQNLPNFFRFLLPDSNLTYSSVTAEDFQGRKAIHLTRSSPYTGGATVFQYWIDSANLTPIAYQVEDNPAAGEKDGHYYGFTGVKFDAPLDAACFSLKPPQGVTKLFSPDNAPEVGQSAPPITLRSIGGPKFNLAEELKKHKCVIVNFWFVTCGYCRREFPTLEAHYKKLKAQGLQVLAIDQGMDKDKDIASFVKEYGLTFPVLVNAPNSKFDAIDAYHVTGCPINYVITPDGKVAAIIDGFGGAKSVAEMDNALRKVGFQL